MVPETQTTYGQKSQNSRGLTPRERRRRYLLLALLLVLLALLAYASYYFYQNRRLPIVQVAAPTAAIQPPRFLYAFSGNGANELSRPVGLGVAEDGRIYVVDFGKRRISVFTNNGKFLFSFAKIDGGVLRNPVHLWVKDGEVWVTDRRLRGIFVFDLEGKFKRQFESTGEKIEWTPLSLAFSEKGELRVTDVGDTEKHRIHYFSAEGSRTITFGKTFQALSLEDNPGGFYFPNGLAVASNGDVYVSDGDNRRIQVFDDEGTFKQFIDTSGVPRGIAIDTEQRLYAVDAIAHTVDVYDLKGARLTQFGGQGFGPGQFNYPNDVITDQRNRIYITDRDNDQVQVWGWPVAEPPTVAAPTSLLGWLACLSPLFLLPLLFLLRKVRIVVAPDFVDALITAEKIEAVSKRRRLRLVAPEDDRGLYEGRTEEGVVLTELITFEVHSDSDTNAVREKLDIEYKDAVYLSMAMRARALATQDRELRRSAVLAEVRVLDLKDFLEDYLGEDHS